MRRRRVFEITPSPQGDVRVILRGGGYGREVTFYLSLDLAGLTVEGHFYRMCSGRIRWGLVTAVILLLFHRSHDLAIDLYFELAASSVRDPDGFIDGGCVTLQNGDPRHVVYSAVSGYGARRAAYDKSQKPRTYCIKECLFNHMYILVL
jgi:hypothetical protein